MTCVNLGNGTYFSFPFGMTKMFRVSLLLYHYPLALNKKRLYCSAIILKR